MQFDKKIIINTYIDFDKAFRAVVGRIFYEENKIMVVTDLRTSKNLKATINKGSLQGCPVSTYFLLGTLTIT